jgi:RNA 2',3'-cyclic 3'-phosphodiesterase
MMRAFCALNLDVASVRRLHETALALRAHALAPEARWVPPTKMHVTLKFFGEVDLGLGPALADAIAPLASPEPVIRVRLSRLAGFPEDESARVVVALVDDTAGDVRRTAERVEEATNRLGLEREAREFRPHVTLARLRRPGSIDPWLGSVRLPAEPAIVTELVLYRSDFSSAGHEYVALARFAMGSARATR